MIQVSGAATAGNLDLSFGNGGLGELPDMTRGMAALPDKKLIVVTGSNHQKKFTVARFNEAGEFDESFGERGVVELPIRGLGMFPRRIVALNSGKYLIAAYQTGAVSTKKYIIRLLEDGSFDNSFGDNGIATINIADVAGASIESGVRFFNGSERENSAEGKFFSEDWLAFSELHAKIYLSAGITTDDEGFKGIVFRLDEDGSLDETFNGGYTVLRAQDDGFSIRLGSLAVHGDGVLVGATTFPVGGFLGDAFVIRYNQSGSADTSFGDRGTVLIRSKTDDRKSIVTSLAVRDDGLIIASGEAKKDGANQGLITVLNASGSFNLIFNKGEPLYADLLSDLLFSSCVLQQDKKIIVTGPGDAGYLVAARYDLTGSLDLTFGDEGWVVFRALGQVGVRSSELTVDNKIVVLGRGNSAVRYLG
jgi:uncharacterized delta-60 repeat protein